MVFQQLFCKSNASTRMKGRKKKLELDFAWIYKTFSSFHVFVALLSLNLRFEFFIFFSSFFFVLSWVFGVLQVYYCTMIFVRHMLCSCFTLLIVFLRFCFSYFFPPIAPTLFCPFRVYFKFEQLCVSCSFKLIPLHFEL